MNIYTYILNQLKYTYIYILYILYINERLPHFKQSSEHFSQIYLDLENLNIFIRVYVNIVIINILYYMHVINLMVNYLLVLNM